MKKKLDFILKNEVGERTFYYTKRPMRTMGNEKDSDWWWTGLWGNTYYTGSYKKLESVLDEIIHVILFDRLNKRGEN